jgi:hypothetical protein
VRACVFTGGRPIGLFSIVLWGGGDQRKKRGGGGVGSGASRRGREMNGGGERAGVSVAFYFASADDRVARPFLKARAKVRAGGRGGRAGAGARAAECQARS